MSAAILGENREPGDVARAEALDAARTAYRTYGDGTGLAISSGAAGVDGAAVAP